MGIFRRNAGKLALIALIVFFSLPFIYGNEEEENFSPFAVKSGLSYQANPISKLANRIASFYGLPQANLTTVGERVNMDKGESIRSRVSEHKTFNKNQVSESDYANQNHNANATPKKPDSIAQNYNAGYEKYFNREDGNSDYRVNGDADYRQGNRVERNEEYNFEHNAKYNADYHQGNQVDYTASARQVPYSRGYSQRANDSAGAGVVYVDTASAKTSSARRGYSSIDRGDPTIYEPARESAVATTATSVNYNNYTYNKPKDTPAVEYVQIDGANYKVIQDITGKKYVATAKGHIPYEEVVRNTISEREFLAAKKRLVNANDSEVLQYIMEQRNASGNTGSTVNNATQNYGINNYRGSAAATGAATTMGGAAVNAGSSIKTDTGFDDSMFSEVYEGLKNINSKGGNYSNSRSSSSSSSSTGGGYRSNSGSGSGNKQNIDTGIIAGVNLGNIKKDISETVTNTTYTSKDTEKDEKESEGTVDESLINVSNGKTKFWEDLRSSAKGAKREKPRVDGAIVQAIETGKEGVNQAMPTRLGAVETFVKGIAIGGTVAEITGSQVSGNVTNTRDQQVNLVGVPADTERFDEPGQTGQTGEGNSGPYTGIGNAVRRTGDVLSKSAKVIGDVTQKVYNTTTPSVVKKQLNENVNRGDSRNFMNDGQY